MSYGVINEISIVKVDMVQSKQEMQLVKDLKALEMVTGCEREVAEVTLKESGGDLRKAC